MKWLLLCLLFPTFALAEESLPTQTVEVTYPDEGCEGLERPVRFVGEKLALGSATGREVARIRRGGVISLDHLGKELAIGSIAFQASFDLLLCQPPLHRRHIVAGEVVVSDDSSFSVRFGFDVADPDYGRWSINVRYGRFRKDHNYGLLAISFPWDVREVLAETYDLDVSEVYFEFHLVSGESTQKKGGENG